MLLSGTRASLRVLSCGPARSTSSTFTSTVRAAHQPRPSLSLDPSLKSLLHDVDISLMSKPEVVPARELQALENDAGEVEYHDMIHEDYPIEEPARRREDRKSPAARFGSDRIGTVILPPELERVVTALIEGTNKTLLHSDAKRLFAEQDDSGETWSTAYNVEYKNRRQRYQHSARDGNAFASVILPVHYAAIYAVLRHVKHRLGTLWNVDRVIDWGAATGSGLWAVSNAFQRLTGEEPSLANSTVATYVGIDQRDGLVSIAKQLLQKTELGTLRVTWRKSFQEEYCVDPVHDRSTLALSAFMLSALPSPLARKNMVKEMWNSGAQTIILVDHSSAAGFQNIAEARRLLLDLGRKETENPETMNQPLRGSHVIAPCPHDRPCPLQHSGPSSLACGFSQRLQRPAFVRRTKHAKQGHEDIGYSYVVIRRGPRPENTTPAGERLVGRVGGVEKEALERAEAGRGVLRELQRAHEQRHDRIRMDPQSPPFPVTTAGSEHARSLPATDVNSVPADQAARRVHVPVSDGVGTGAAQVLGRVASADAASFMLPRVDVDLTEETMDRAQERDVSSRPITTPPAPVQTPGSTAQNAGYSGSEPRPDCRALEGLESPSNLEEVLRNEAYGWPRLVFPPLKKSGHIILDACTREGKIMRLTIPKSQGKQPFYDARKSSWGDIFPHAPKNRPIERFQPADESTSKPQRLQKAQGSDIGKRSRGRDRTDRGHERSYAELDDTLWKEQKARWKASKKESANSARDALRLVDSDTDDVHYY